MTLSSITRPALAPAFSASPRDSEVELQATLPNAKHAIRTTLPILCIFIHSPPTTLLDAAVAARSRAHRFQALTRLLSAARGSKFQWCSHHTALVPPSP